MGKRILLTGATDGIGLETAKKLVALGHEMLLHGRNADKLAAVAQTLKEGSPDATIETYVADLSRLEEVESLARAVLANHDHLDVLINNAGVFATPNPVTPEGLDVRFMVNTLAPYRLTHCLLPGMGNSGRVVSLSSAAQAPVNLEALKGDRRLADSEAYAQSKLALTMWSRHLALTHPDGPIFVAVNPGSLLGSKMVKEAYGMAGKDLGVGAEILVRAASDAEFAEASGQYFDNDSGHFATPHPEAMIARKIDALVATMEQVIAMLERS